MDPSSSPSSRPDREQSESKNSVLPLALGALGVVYGDIGTSPLYAIRECFHGPHAMELTSDNVHGVLSLVFWSLLIVISLKYLAFVMRADNRGEGGILALLALVRPKVRDGRMRQVAIIAMGIFGAALLYGDGIITPAISVLSALEGLSIATPLFESYILPLAIVILVGLFLVQSHGTARVGAMFGPIMLLWFGTLALLGLWSITQHPQVLFSVSPHYAYEFFRENGVHGFLILGTVFLVVTGGEALYADMGHFGRGPIRLAWFSLVLPALALNYFGQGALLLRDPSHAVNPFFHLAPGWALYPMVVLATAATVIASQAVISGAFSLTRQAVQLGYSPRVRIEHTSYEEIGQIYVPSTNWALMVATIVLVVEFRTSSNLAAAYGVAVTSTMVITTALAYFVARHRWGWGPAAALLVTAFFLAFDVAFFGSSLVKVPQGGWVPLLIALGIFTSMTTWKRGREILLMRLEEVIKPFPEFLRRIESERPARLRHAAVFMTSDTSGTPPALIHNLEHNEVLHQPVILLTVETEEVPYVPSFERLQVTPLGAGFHRAIARYGFMQDPSVPEIVSRLKEHGLDLELEEITFFLGGENIIATRLPGMAIWREKLFALMNRNALGATDFFHIPAARVIEVRRPVEI
jgi:KUP system potassium uptake protein